MKNKITESIKKYKKRINYAINVIEAMDNANLDNKLNDEEKKDTNQRLYKLYTTWYEDTNNNIDVVTFDLQTKLENMLKTTNNFPQNFDIYYIHDYIEKYTQINDINLSTAMIDYQNNTESMQKISFDAKLIHIKKLNLLLDQLKNITLEKNQKIEINLMCNLSENFNGHFTPIIIRKTSQRIKLFAIEPVDNLEVFYHLSKYIELSSSTELNVNIIIPKQAMQKDEGSCFFYAISHLRILAQLSDDALDKYFEQNYSRTDKYYSTQEDLFQIPAMVKYTQSISQLDKIKNDPVIKEKLDTGVKKTLTLSKRYYKVYQIENTYNKIISNETLDDDSVYYDYKLQHQSINYYKNSFTDKTIDYIQNKEETDLKTKDDIVLSTNNTEDYLNSRIKTANEYDNNKCSEKYCSKSMINEMNYKKQSKTETIDENKKETDLETKDDIVLSTNNTDILKYDKERKPISNIHNSRLLYFVAKLATFGGKIVKLKQKDVNEVKKRNNESPKDEHVPEVGTFVKLISKTETKNYYKGK
jgi:hypothetical protein